MYTLSISRKPAGAETVYILMQRLDPSGTHRMEDINEALSIIKNTRPDIVWLEATREGLDLAAKCRQESPRTNFIFLSDGPQMAADAFKVHASGYIQEPVTEELIRVELMDLRHPVAEDRGLLQIKCFGTFEVFRGGRIVRFARSLSKEALAYLVDRRGAGCTVSEMCSVLWENRVVDTNLKSQCRVILGSLRKDLASVGAESVLVKDWNMWGIDTDLVSCDYYDYLMNEGRCAETFRGEYMAQYSWAEVTSGSLYQMASKQSEEL